MPRDMSEYQRTMGDEPVVHGSLVPEDEGPEESPGSIFLNGNAAPAGTSVSGPSYEEFTSVTDVPVNDE